ncbi:MAG: hydantoinase B/oxoprolinase family protein [Candidatus Acetothermia bacterium]|jgi:N-methylhydantoinase B|nr:hydantoinase B/oxoprolinase family protein [Candidatus Acetothermia bacterium]MDH7504800.1 hydantoinase B/oxoprolinase family protein [Candidatus Acetothermia bacterium]
MPIDAVTLEVLRNALVGVAEEMNANLVRTGFSPNIKERRDCSAALFDPRGRLVAQAESIPVHLGAMPFSVRAALERFPELAPGDTVVLNDPFAGGAHLPDLTFVTPVFHGQELVALAANRAHHADIGGQAPGSLAGDSTEIYQEGLRLPPVRLWKAGRLDEELLGLILANVRTPEERWGDLRAQFAANETGRRRFLELLDRYGPELLAEALEALLDYSERRMRAALAAIPPGVYEADDSLDGPAAGGEPVKIRARVTISGDEIAVDFSGSAAQVEGPINAVYAVTASAVYYTVRALTDPDIPPNEGCYRPIRINAPEGTIVNARPPAAVVGGNLETSQRIVDVLIRALAPAMPERAIAACQGTMNNLALGGLDPRTGRAYTFYETIGGGFGARAGKDGLDGVHSHMTNTLNTPIEALEIAYPLRVERYELHEDSGGAGRWRGGLGIRREIRVLGRRARLSLLADRRTSAPYGLFGGEPGELGADAVLSNGEWRPIPGRAALVLEPGSVVRIETPGGGGYGDPRERERALILRDLREGRLSRARAIESYGFDPEG